MRFLIATGAAAVAGLALATPAAAVDYSDGSVYARVTATEIVLGNSLVERRWTRSPFRTSTLVDKRAGGRRWGWPGRDFRLSLTAARAR